MFLIINTKNHLKMKKYHKSSTLFALLCASLFIANSTLVAQSYDDCADAYDITSLINGLQEGETASSIQFDNTNATGGEETNPDNLICLFDKVIENSLWVTFTGNGNSYIIGTTECGATESEYLNTSQAIVYQGDCDNLEFISCNEFQQESQAPNDFTFKAYLNTEVGVQYYMLLDGSDATFEPDWNVVGKFCLEIEQISAVSCGDDNLEFTWKREEGLDKYICWDEFHTLEVVEMIVPNGSTDPGNTTGYIMVISSEDLTNVDDPFNTPGAAVYCCSTEADRVTNYLHGSTGDFVGPHFIKWYYYFNSPFQVEPGFEVFPDINGADCVVESNQLDMFFMPMDSDLAITGTNITNSTTAQGNGEISLTVTGGAGEYEIFWDNGDSGEFIDELAVGDYSVTITDISFCFEPIIADFTISGVSSSKDITQANQVMMYPNPTNGLVYLSSDKFSGQTEIVIYSIDGKNVYNQVKEFNSGSPIEVDLNHLETGIYMVKYFDGENIGEQRLIISK